MDSVDPRLLHGLEAELRRDDPRFARAMETGRPCRPREYRHGSAWLLLAVAVVAVVVGFGWNDGWLVVGGIVLAGIAGHLFDPYRARICDHGPGRW